jgi:hypothetical protein
MKARRIVATSEDRSHPCYQSRHLAVAFPLQLYNSLLYSTVNVHVALGGSCPGGSLSMLVLPCLIGKTLAGDCPSRWQQRQWHTITTGQWRCLSFSEGQLGEAWQSCFSLRWRWILKSVIFVFAFIVMLNFESVFLYMQHIYKI